MKKYKKVFLEFINHFEVYLGTVIFIGMMILLTLQVVTRYVFGQSFTWTEELGAMMFIWLVYLGSCAAVLEGKHLRIDLFLSMMKGRVKKCALLFTNLVSMVFCLYIIFPLYKIISALFNRNAASLLLHIPTWISYSVIPFCMVLMFIRLVQDSIRIIKTKDIDQDENAKQPSIFDDVDGQDADSKRQIGGEQA